jgi:hypothetical protein
VSVEIPLVGRYRWEPAPATDLLSNMFLNVSLMEIEGGLVKCNVKAGEAGKPSTRAIDTVIKLKIIEEYSCVDGGHAEVFAEGRSEPFRMTSASSVLISDGDVKADDTMSTKNGGKVEGDVALVGEEFVVGAGAEVLWIGFHRDGGGRGAGGVDYLFVMWVGRGEEQEG